MTRAMENSRLKLKLWFWISTITLIYASAILISIAYYFGWIGSFCVVDFTLGTTIVIVLLSFTTYFLVRDAKHSTHNIILNSSLLLIAAVFVTAIITLYFGWIKLADFVNFSLSALVVILLGNYLRVRQERFTRNIAERQEFNAAIENLSSSNPAVRLKGVKALYRRAEKIQKQYFPVEEETQIGGKEGQMIEIWSLLNSHVRHYTQDINYQKNFPEKPSIDIQEAIDIQGRREKYKNSNVFLNTEPRVRVEWTGAWLRGAKLEDAQLQGADLRIAQLRRANLQGAQLQEANLQGARLQESDLTIACLQRANLMNARLQVANLTSAQLQEAHLAHAYLQWARLSRAYLNGARLNGAQLHRADIFDAHLQGADLQEAQLQCAHLHKVQLQGANLREAQLQGASLQEVHLQGAYNSEDFMHFQDKGRVGINTEIGSVVLKGGFTKDSYEGLRKRMDLDAEFWRDWERKELNRILNDLCQNHIGDAIVASSEEGEHMLDVLKKEGSVVIGKYTEGEANQWIKEFYEVSEDVGDFNEFKERSRRDIKNSVGWWWQPRSDKDIENMVRGGWLWRPHY